MRYALLICNDENAVISPEEQSRRAAAFTSFQEEMEACGVLLGRARLRPTATGWAGRRGPRVHACEL